jgi:hypothetical protein
MPVLKPANITRPFCTDQWHIQEFFWEGGLRQNFFFVEGVVQQIQLRTEGRENGDLGAVAP